MILSIPYNKLCEMGYYFCESMQKCILENDKCENEINITYLNEEKNDSLINQEKESRRLQILDSYGFQDYDDRHAHIANNRLWFILVILVARMAMMTLFSFPLSCSSRYRSPFCADAFSGAAAAAAGRVSPPPPKGPRRGGRGWLIR